MGLKPNPKGIIFFQCFEPLTLLIGSLQLNCPIKPVPDMTNVFGVGEMLYLTQFKLLNCSLQGQLVQMSTTHSHFDQYCIIHSIHRAAAAPGLKSTP